MTATRSGLASARRHLDVFAESWKADHEQAMQCRDFEDFLTEAVSLFQLIDSLVRRRREAVFRGREEANSQLDEEEKALYYHWLATVEADLARLDSLEKTYGHVEGAERLRDSREKARTFLANWAPAVLARAVGSRAGDFSEEDADQVQVLLNAPARAPGRPTRPLRRVPPGDLSQLG
jgi:hypothetical protein